MRFMSLPWDISIGVPGTTCGAYGASSDDTSRSALPSRSFLLGLISVARRNWPAKRSHIHSLGWFRNRASTAAVEREEGIDVASRALGHTNIATTRKHYDRAQMTRALARFSQSQEAAAFAAAEGPAAVSHQGHTDPRTPLKRANPSRTPETRKPTKCGLLNELNGGGEWDRTTDPALMRRLL